MFLDLCPFQDLQDTLLGLQRRSLFGPDNLFPILLFHTFWNYGWPQSDQKISFKPFLYLLLFHVSLHESFFLLLNITFSFWLSLDWGSILKVPRPHLASSSQMTMLPIWPKFLENNLLLLFLVLFQDLLSEKKITWKFL